MAYAQATQNERDQQVFSRGDLQICILDGIDLLTVKMTGGLIASVVLSELAREIQVLASRRYRTLCDSSASVLFGHYDNPSLCIASVKVGYTRSQEHPTHTLDRPV
ncbi:hypothetical protein An09g02600 [Aspergillus niger]|uniref:Uncharacterized protein n=2 Tax=Aspergillus niger TaxID=5061 RepID=A2QTM1_ASPNC|nr:hypothetical protein An09g02600 [Aspergillus niger]CAK40196.1 hypothetical protein An09g02600 [Aspergillus niger]